ncbi:MAG: EamA family transporter [Candidatus Woesearchaeota archaeon]
MKKKGLFLVLLTALISGISIFVNTFGVKGINPYMFTGLKNIIVAILLFSIILLAKNFNELKKLKKKEWYMLILVGLIGGSIPFLLFFKGLQLTTAASGSFVHKTMVVWVIIFSILFLKEKINYKYVIGAFFLLAGNFLLLKLTGLKIDQGMLLILIATIIWSVEIIISKQLLNNLSGNIVAFGRMFFGSIFITIFLFVTNNFNSIQKFSTTHLVWIIITSIFLLGYVITFYNGLKYVSTSTATAILSLGSVVTTICQLIFTNVSVGVLEICGLVLIIVGVLAFIRIKDLISVHTFSHA